ncbi:hypothetical protein JTB14_023242 [Gonioctena quinquepunctata]|nr:hypothetical protein JTB14_023242 [Gonioctena quinquepunctata]
MGLIERDLEDIAAIVDARTERLMNEDYMQSLAAMIGKFVAAEYEKSIDSLTTSLIPHFAKFQKRIVDEDCDIVGVGETWLSDGISSNMVALNGYTFVRQDRPTRDRPTIL